MAISSNLSAWVVAQCETISDLTGNVFNYNEPNPGSFPNARVLFGGSPEAEFSSLKTTWRTYSFTTRISYEVAETGGITAQEAELAMLDIADELTDIFDQNRSAGGNAKLLGSTISATEWLDTAYNIRYCDITTEFQDLRDAD